MKRFRFVPALVGGLLLAASPAPGAAQTAPDAPQAEAGEAAMDETMAMLSGMFPAEPLTAEQQARLPQAQRIIARIIPEGTMGEMMSGMFDQMLGPIMKMADAPATEVVSKGLPFSRTRFDFPPCPMWNWCVPPS